MFSKSSAILATAVAAAVLAGGLGTTGTPVPDSAFAKSGKTTKLRLQDSSYGRVLFDNKGGALYLFTKERRAKSRCYGECARVWPPFFARGKLRGGAGVDQALLGKITRRDGRKQVTYAGHPLYYYVGDTRNQIYCNDVFEFGGDWFVVQASGEPAH